jgi:hypothetical protein
VHYVDYSSLSNKKAHHRGGIETDAIQSAFN